MTRAVILLTGLAGLLSTGSASAQVYLNPPALIDEAVTGAEAGLGVSLPEATTGEYAAALVWNMRSGLNVAALQCAHSPFLDTTDNYNALLTDKREDLALAYKALTGYFRRAAGAKPGVRAFDDYNTKSYNGWSTLYAQRGFCNAAGRIGKDLRFVPQGQMIGFAQQRMRGFRSSLVPGGDPMWAPPALYVPLPEIRYPDRCYDRQGRVRSRCLR